jgi:hypothetical protein
LTSRVAPAWAGPAELSVFVNCPFDATYREGRDAIIFAAVHAGFFPWMADSTGTAADPRMNRILTALSHCRYSIHDLTRYRGEGPENLARFNLPLELGMAMALRSQQPEPERHDWLAMVSEGHEYQRYISDLAGFDPAQHDGSPERIAVAVLSWLVTRPSSDALVDPDEVLGKLPGYARRKLALDRRWAGRPPWREVIDLAVDVARG